MSVLTDEARAVLAAGKLAHLVTLADGAPQISVVWIGLVPRASRPREPGRTRWPGWNKRRVPHQRKGASAGNDVANLDDFQRYRWPASCSPLVTMR